MGDGDKGHERTLNTRCPKMNAWKCVIRRRRKEETASDDDVEQREEAELVLVVGDITTVGAVLTVMSLRGW